MRKYNIFIFLTVLLLFSIIGLSKDNILSKASKLFNTGQSYFNQENYQKALTQFTVAKELCEKNNQTENLLYIKILRRIGDCHYYLSNYNKAIKTYENAIENINLLLQKNKSKNLLIHKGHLLTMLGNIFKIFDCNKALSYYQESLNIYKKTEFNPGIGGCFLNIGDCFAETGEIDKAIEYTKKAIIFFKKKDYYSLSIAYSNLADFYIQKKDFASAALNLEQAILFSTKGNRKRQLIFNYLKLGKLKKEQGKYNEALINFQKALELSKRIKDKEAVRKTLLLMSDCYAKSGNYREAYICSLEFIENSRELFSKQLIEQLATIESKHKAKAMEQKLKKLEKISKKQQKSLFLHKTTLLIVLLFILIFLILLRQRQKLIEDVERKNKDLELLIGTIEKVSKTDDLTGLPNRRGLLEYMEREISRALRQKETFSFAICDLDNFKSINDNFSHQVGDIVLMAVSRTFQDLIRKVDIVARFGGEEFIFVFPNTTLKNAQKVCEKIRRTIEETEFVVYDTPIKITLTFGVTEFSHQKSFETLLQEADKALYRGKETGKNTVITFAQYLEK